MHRSPGKESGPERRPPQRVCRVQLDSWDLLQSWAEGAAWVQSEDLWGQAIVTRLYVTGMSEYMQSVLEIIGILKSLHGWGCWKEWILESSLKVKEVDMQERDSMATEELRSKSRATLQMSERQCREGEGLSPEILPDSPWGFIRGSSSLQTFWVPKKLVFIVTSAWMWKGVGSSALRGKENQVSWVKM